MVLTVMQWGYGVLQCVSLNTNLDTVAEDSTTNPLTKLQIYPLDLYFMVLPFSSYSNIEINDLTNLLDQVLTETSFIFRRY